MKHHDLSIKWLASNYYEAEVILNLGWRMTLCQTGVPYCLSTFERGETSLFAAEIVVNRSTASV